jgi:hypothetical protein
MSDTPEQRRSEIQARLDRIAVYPGASWPNTYEVEGALLRDVHARGAEGKDSHWVGGTLASARLIASAPDDLRWLLA